MLDLLFPKKCYGCQQEGVYLCNKCRQLIATSKLFQRCCVCQRLSYLGKVHSSCQKEKGIDGIYSLFVYKSPISQMIMDFKYYQVRELLPVLAELVGNELKDKKILSFFRNKKFIFTPVPLFPFRQLWRGFNQSELVMKTLAKTLDLPTGKFLKRKKWTKQQASLAKQDRDKNVVDAFDVIDTNLVKNRNIIVFDDVCTSGKTLRSCSRPLKLAGANSVWGLTICR